MCNVESCFGPFLNVCVTHHQSPHHVPFRHGHSVVSGLRRGKNECAVNVFGIREGQSWSLVKGPQWTHYWLRHFLKISSFSQISLKPQNGTGPYSALARRPALNNWVRLSPVNHKWAKLRSFEFLEVKRLRVLEVLGAMRRVSIKDHRKWRMCVCMCVCVCVSLCLYLCVCECKCLWQLNWMGVAKYSHISVEIEITIMLGGGCMLFTSLP